MGGPAMKRFGAYPFEMLLAGSFVSVLLLLAATGILKPSPGRMALRGST